MTSFSKVVEAHQRAVVQVIAEAGRRNERARGASGEDPFFRHFAHVSREPRPFPPAPTGTGSGIILDPEGHILTSLRLVEGAERVTVKTSGIGAYEATLVGGDPKTNLAVVRISSETPLPHVVFGDSDMLRAGDRVIFVGRSGVFGHTVATGVISAQHYLGIIDPGGVRDFLVIDGNVGRDYEGAPLFNLGGEVVGLCMTRVTPSGGFEGLTFAVPAAMALHVSGQLTAHGVVERSWLGLRIRDAAPEDSREGALIEAVTAGGPGETAGLRPGDPGGLLWRQRGRRRPRPPCRRGRKSCGGEGAARGGAGRVTIGPGGGGGRPSGGVREAVGLAQEPAGGWTFGWWTERESRRYGLRPGAGHGAARGGPGRDPSGVAGFERGDIILEIDGRGPGGKRFRGRCGGGREVLPAGHLACTRSPAGGRIGYVQVIAR